MEMVLGGGANLTATEAQSLGLVSKVVPADQLIEEAVKTASKIASKSQASVQMGKELINKCKYYYYGLGAKKKRDQQSFDYLTYAVCLYKINSLRSSSFRWFAMGTCLLPSFVRHRKLYFLFYLITYHRQYSLYI